MHSELKKYSKKIRAFGNHSSVFRYAVVERVRSKGWHRLV